MANTNEIELLVREGWILNPNEKVVSNITRMASRNGGHCPCLNKYRGTDDDICPCKAYREEDHCCCGLYLKKEE